MMPRRLVPAKTPKVPMWRAEQCCQDPAHDVWMVLDRFEHIDTIWHTEDAARARAGDLNAGAEPLT